MAEGTPDGRKDRRQEEGDVHSDQGAQWQAAEEAAGRMDGGRQRWKQILIGPDTSMSY